MAVGANGGISILVQGEERVGSGKEARVGDRKGEVPVPGRGGSGWPVLKSRDEMCLTPVAVAGLQGWVAGNEGVSSVAAYDRYGWVYQGGH